MKSAGMHVVGVWLGGLVLSAIGCAGPLSPTPVGYSVEKLPDVADAEAFAAAVRTMREFYRVAEADASALLVRSRPAESTERRQTGRLRDVLGPTSHRIRRIAELRLDRRPDGLYGLARVTVQELETAEARAMAAQRRFWDAPTETPIERDFGRSRRENEVWTDAGRDRPAERALLQALRERLRELVPASQPESAPAGGAR